MRILIRPAILQDTAAIAHIGRTAMEASHRESCSTADMTHFLDLHYNEMAIEQELNTSGFIYLMLFCDGVPAGFSKVVLNCHHANIASANTTKLDRLYLLGDFQGANIGSQLLQHNIELSKANDQSGMWLFTWTGNKRAVDFYFRNGFTIVGEHHFKISETHSNPNHQMLLRY